MQARLKNKSQDSEIKNATKVKINRTVYYECVTAKQSTENSGLKFRDVHKCGPKTPVLGWKSGLYIMAMPFPRGTVFMAIVTIEIYTHVGPFTVFT